MRVEPIFAPISSSIEADPVSIISVEKSYEPAYPSGVVVPYRSIPIAAQAGEDSISECTNHGANGGTSQMIEVDAAYHLPHSARFGP